MLFCPKIKIVQHEKWGLQVRNISACGRYIHLSGSETGKEFI